MDKIFGTYNNSPDWLEANLARIVHLKPSNDT